VGHEQWEVAGLDHVHGQREAFRLFKLQFSGTDARACPELITDCVNEVKNSEMAAPVIDTAGRDKGEVLLGRQLGDDRRVGIPDAESENVRRCGLG